MHCQAAVQTPDLVVGRCHCRCCRRPEVGSQLGHRALVQQIMQGQRPVGQHRRAQSPGQQPLPGGAACLPAACLLLLLLRAVLSGRVVVLEVMVVVVVQPVVVAGLLRRLRALLLRLLADHVHHAPHDVPDRQLCGDSMRVTTHWVHARHRNCWFTTSSPGNMSMHGD